MKISPKELNFYLLHGCASFSLLPSAKGLSPPIQRFAAVWRRRQEGAKTPSGFLIPLLTPPHLPSDATPSGRASKCEGPTGTSGAPRVNA